MNNKVVYQLVDSSGVVRYIGQGSPARPYAQDGRSDDYLSVLASGGKIQILFDGLSRSDAIKLENELIERHSTTLLNRNLQTTLNVLDPEELRKLFVLDTTSPSGIVWAVDRYNCSKTLKAKAGTQAGSFNGKNGWVVPLNGKYIKVHRVVWALAYNVILDNPDLVINHIDGHPKNNKLANLELCTQRVNCIKRTRHPKNTTGFVGVKLEIRAGRSPTYRASFSFPDGRRILKSFSVSKYGLLPAYANAVKWRKEMSELYIERN